MNARSGTLDESLTLEGGEIVINAIFLVALTAFGLVFGSFANVVIWRFPRGESLSHPDSHCPVCSTPIQWRDNIPVISWLVLKGRCRACGVQISPRYPTVELVSGVLWLAAGIRFGLTLQTAAAVVFFYLLMILAFIDIDTLRLPNPLVTLLASAGLLGAVISQLTHVPMVPILPGGSIFAQSPLIASVEGALLCAFPAMTLSLVMSALLKRPALGMGDVKLLGVLGIFLGAYGLLAFFIGSLIGSVHGIVAARSRGNQAAAVSSGAVIDQGFDSSGHTATGDSPSPSQPFPFGPSLAAGAVIVTLVGPQLWKWYQSLFLV